MLLLAVVALAACVSSTSDGVMTPETRKGGFAGLSTNANIKAATPAAFKEKQKVVIGGFKVGFNESKRMSKKAGGGLLGGGFGGKSTGLVKLEGAGGATKQEITDKVYKDFIAQLQANGYQVVARSEFTSSEYYQGTKTYDFPYVDDNSGLLSSYGAGSYYSPRAIGSKQPIFMGEIQGVTGGIGFSNPGNAAAEFGVATGISVLNVTYFVDFAGSDGHGSYWSSTSSLKVGQMLSVDQGFVGITTGHGGTFSKNIGNLTLGQAIASDKEFATIEETSSAAEKGVGTAVNVASALLGGGTNQMKKYTYKTTPTKYKSASIDILTQANASFVEKMVSLR